MPPEISTETAPTQSPAPVVKDAAPVNLIAKYVAIAEKEQAAEVAGEAPAKAAPKGKQAKGKIDPKAVKLETTPDAITPEPAADAAAREKARYYLQHGDVAKAIEASLGDLSDLNLSDGAREALARKLNVDSGSWAKFRRYETEKKHEIAQREQKVHALVGDIQQKYDRYYKAHEAYDAGDLESAIQLAFGDDLVEFNRKSVNTRLSKNPEVEQLKVQLQQERQARLDFERRQKQEVEVADQQRHIQMYVAELTNDLQTSDDPQVAKFAQKQAFVNRVFQLQREAYQASGVELPTAMVAATARDEIVAALSEWEYSGGNPAQSVQAAAMPEQPPLAKARVRNLSHSKAAEANSSPRVLTREERIAKYSKLMSQAQD